MSSLRDAKNSMEATIPHNAQSYISSGHTIKSTHGAWQSIVKLDVVASKDPLGHKRTSVCGLGWQLLVCS
jgi:hypothetical protein